MSEVVIVEESKGNALILRFTGRLDAISSPIAEKKIAEFIDAGKNNIVLNFEKIDYVSSAGMRLLLTSTKKMKAKNGKIVMSNIVPMVMDVIKMAGFDHILTMADNEENALKLFI